MSLFCVKEDFSHIERSEQLFLFRLRWGIRFNFIYLLPLYSVNLLVLSFSKSINGERGSEGHIIYLKIGDLFEEDAILLSTLENWSP